MSHAKEPKFRLRKDGCWEQASTVYHQGKLVYKMVDESVVRRKCGTEFIRLERKRQKSMEGQQRQPAVAKVKSTTSEAPHGRAGTIDGGALKRKSDGQKKRQHQQLLSPKKVGPSKQELDEVHETAAKRARTIMMEHGFSKFCYVRKPQDQKVLDQRTAMAGRLMFEMISHLSRFEEEQEEEHSNNRSVMTKGSAPARNETTSWAERNPPLSAGEWLEVLSGLTSHSDMSKLYLEKVGEICRNVPPSNRKPWANYKGVCAYCYAHTKTDSQQHSQHALDETCPFAACTCMSCASMDEIRPDEAEMIK